MADNNNLMSNQEAVKKAQDELLAIQKQVQEALDSLKGTEEQIASKEQELKRIQNDLGLKEKLGFFGEHIDYKKLFRDYADSATTKNGLDEGQFLLFLSVIIYFNNVIDGETRSITMNGEVVQLHDIPFDARLNAILAPASVTFDVYSNEMHDFKQVDKNLKCDVSLYHWIKLQQQFFRNWKNKNADESNSLKDVMQRATLQQVSKRIFFEGGTGKSVSNYWRPESGEIFMMPIHISTKLWDVHGDCVSYDEAVFRTFNAMYGRIATS